MSEIIVFISRMKRVRAIDTVNDTITVEAGALLKEIRRPRSAAGCFR